MQIFNQYSAVFSLIVPLVLLGVAMAWRKRPFLSRASLLMGLALLAILGFFLLQPEADSVPPGEVERLLSGSSGQPVFLELYSDY